MTQAERDELLIRLDERMEQTLEQATKTNGRVTKLEDRAGTLETWQAKVQGGNRVWLLVCSGMGVILGVLATLAVIFV